MTQVRGTFPQLYENQRRGTMPFKSEAQRRYLHVHEPAVATRWEHEGGTPKRLPMHVPGSDAAKREARAVRTSTRPKARRGR